MSNARNLTSSSSSHDKSSNVAVTALDGVINVNSLFTLAIFVGLSFASPGKKTLNTRQSCQPRILTLKHLVVFEVLSFSFLLLSSLVAQALKLSISLLSSAEVGDGFSVHINRRLLRTGMLMTVIS
ncbi:hypothetical protein KY284_036162 [Solanum tuberosum]|nr:hypothetical protein KY284_036162 [Solanum tuberosum]